MKLRAGITGEGIALSFGESEPRRLEPSPEANQVAPLRHYVYPHYHGKGAPFYVGKGIARRAWDDSRHALWHRYVERHLNGRYSVRILADDLSPEDAESLESEWIAQESNQRSEWTAEKLRFSVPRRLRRWDPVKLNVRRHGTAPFISIGITDPLTGGSAHE
jgi:hypothetical protein